MRLITYSTNLGNVTVRVAGELLTGVTLNPAVVKAAKHSKRWSPAIEENFLKLLASKAADQGAREDEVKAIVSYFKNLIKDA